MIQVSNGLLPGPVTLLQADARNLPLADESVQCIVTSPPYWGLRKYAGEQESVWDGAPNCDHLWTETVRGGSPLGGSEKQKSNEGSSFSESICGICGICGAWRGAYGLEPTIEMYVAHTVAILREMRRVLRRDGVLFWNIGDSYHNGDKGGYRSGRLGLRSKIQRSNMAGDIPGAPNRNPQPGLKPKDLCLIPARIALAAQSDGWWVRSLIIWAKPNPMPESVTDRPTDAYEHILMLTKSERYFWDADAVREPAVTSDLRRPYGSEGMWQMDGRAEEQRHGGELRNAFGYIPKGTHSRGTGNGGRKAQERGSYEGWAESTQEVLTSRNLRNVWMFATQPYSGAHFATFPEELPRRCILAATSAKGACAQCGAPWERVTRPSPEYALKLGKSLGNGRDIEMQEGKATGFGEPRLCADFQTVGWTPTCCCRGQHGRTVPCVVLDPFGGSGTTGRVALSLRRRAVLCDVAYGEQDEYRRLAETRIRNVQVEFPL